MSFSALISFSVTEGAVISFIIFGQDPCELVRIIGHNTVSADADKPVHGFFIVDRPVMNGNISLMRVINEGLTDKADSVFLIGYLANGNTVAVEDIET